MDTKKWQDGKSCLTVTEWNDSQVNESSFWKSQFKINNQEQIQRNAYYKGLLEDGNSIAKDFFDRDFTNAFIAGFRSVVLYGLLRLGYF